jgi:DNA repair protein REV1
MTKSHENSQSSSDYFGEEDSQFLRALETLVLPGDNPQSPPIQSPNHPIEIEDDSEDESPPPPAQPVLKRRYFDLEQEQKVQDEVIYGASHFGQFGEYMRRKRAKLQIQNKDLESNTNEVGNTGIFNGLSIYVSQVLGDSGIRSVLIPCPLSR